LSRPRAFAATSDSQTQSSSVFTGEIDQAIAEAPTKRSRRHPLRGRSTEPAPGDDGVVQAAEVDRDPDGEPVGLLGTHRPSRCLAGV
jgi:hypothetical protein